jgi:hypothetical protein
MAKSSKSDSTSSKSSFRAAFNRWSRRVRARLALDMVLTGAAAGMVVGAGACAAAWQTRHGDLRPFTAAGGLLGAAVGAVVARRRRLSDPEVALFLDARLKSDEAISTAVELEGRATAAAAKANSNTKSATGGQDEDPARAVVITQATEALAKATPKQVRARVLRPWHAAVPLAAAAIGYMTWLPVPPPPPAPPAAPGTEQLKLTDVAGLEKVIKLAEVDARDEAQKERLRKLAEEAKRIREKLKNGVEKREAQADIAKLRDAITAERLQIGEGEQRAGMEAALGKLGENPSLKDAEKALGDRDLVQFDEEMEKLANKLEKEDRERAKKTLEEAAEAAKKAGAPDVAKALEEQKKLMDERGEKSEKLKELAKALGEGLSEDAKEALKDLEGSGSSKAEQELAEKLEEALGKLTPEERKQLAENMKKEASKIPEEALGQQPSKQQMKELAEELSTPEGQKQLEEQLREMAKQPGPESEESERQRALEDAQRGAGEAEGQMGGAPMPVPMAGNQGGGGKKGGGKDGKGGGGKDGKGGGGKDGKGGGGKDGKGENGGSGHSEGGGPGEHDGQTAAVGGDGVKARANAKINKGKPMPGMVMGRTAGRAGETANAQGTGALGTVAPDEVGGVERSDVPEEYREQVGRYFQPK